VPGISDAFGGVSDALEANSTLRLMKFWRLTLRLGLVGATILATCAGVTWTDTCSGSGFDMLCFSRGDVIVFAGVFGFFFGAALGLIVWVGYRFLLWLDRRVFGSPV